MPSSLHNCLMALALLPACLTTVLGANSSISSPLHCPPLGPVLPAPQRPSSNDKVQQAIKGLDQALDKFTAKLNFSAISVGIKSIHENGTLFTKSYSPPTVDARSVKKVDSETVFRVGSVSKLFTMLGVLKIPGLDLNDPITKYVPELKETVQKTAEEDEFPYITWDDITVGALASHLAGTGVDFAPDLTNFPGDYEKLGLPGANKSLTIGCAGLMGTRPCNKTDFLSSFGHHHPIFAPFTTPAYSNVAYAILAFAIENSSNMTFDKYMHKHILDPLGLKHTSTGAKPPVNDSLGFIPKDDIWWGATLGFEDPVGSYYSSSKDLLTFAQAILSNKLLTPLQTHKWMKPLTSTSSTGTQLGAVWEIYRSDNLTADKRLIEVYTKSGDLGPYHAQVVLIPDYDLVMSIIVGGNETSGAMAQQILSAAATALLPALEAAGKAEAARTFAGSYADNSTNSTLTLRVDDDKGGPGLLVDKWVMRGVDIAANYPKFVSLSAVPPGTPLSIRMYPTSLRSGTQWAWRAVFELGKAEQRAGHEAAVFWAKGSCTTWGGHDRIVHQHRALDEFVFDMQNGAATAVLPRVFQVKLKKSSCVVY